MVIICEIYRHIFFGSVKSSHLRWIKQPISIIRRTLWKKQPEHYVSDLSCSKAGTTTLRFNSTRMINLDRAVVWFWFFKLISLRFFPCAASIVDHHWFRSLRTTRTCMTCDMPMAGSKHFQVLVLGRSIWVAMAVATIQQKEPKRYLQQKLKTQHHLMIDFSQV